MAGRDTLFFFGDPQRAANIGGGPVQDGPHPHDPKLLADLRGYAMPVKAATLTVRDFQMPGAPRHYRLGVHEGIDFYGHTTGATVDRSTPVRAVADGVVARALVDYKPASATQADAWTAQIHELGYTPPEVLDGYRRAMELDPYLRSAYYGAGLVLRRLDRAEEAREMLSAYERFADNPRARLAEFKYTRMGRKAETIALASAEPARDPLPDGPLFASPSDLEVPVAGAPSRLTTADLDNDGSQDLFRVDTSDSLVLLGDGQRGFLADPDHPLSGIN